MNTFVSVSVCVCVPLQLNHYNTISLQVVVGTHALLQPTVSFTNLGLLIIDEEQRFGVGHKEKLKVSLNFRLRRVID